MSDTGSMWINMLGLGPLFQTINDPAFQTHIRQIVESIGETSERCKRIEAMLAEMHHGREPARVIPIGIANLSSQLGTDGSGGLTAASRIADDGTGDGQASSEAITDGPVVGVRPHRTLAR